MKVAMINVQQRMIEKNMRSKMILQVHDELVFDVYKPELEAIKKLVKSEMESAYKLDVPLDVELDIGLNWLEAH